MALWRAMASVRSGCMGVLGPAKVRVNHTVPRSRITVMVRLGEESSGDGELLLKSHVLGPVRYQIKVFQGMFANGLPNPTQRTVEGSVDVGAACAAADLVGASLTLQLQDGRKIGIMISDEPGTIHTRPACTTGCSCC